MKFKFSCKLDSIKHNNSELEGEIEKLQVRLENKIQGTGVGPDSSDRMLAI